MARLSPLDAGFLQLEDSHVALHIGSLAIFDGPVPSERELRGRYARVAAASPWYGQRLRRAPFDLRRPTWSEPGAVDLDYHLRRTALPAPGASRQLERLVGRIMSYRLDPDRPLWEAWVVEGLEAGRWALVTKVHHSVVDGLGGMALFGQLLDLDRGDAPPSGEPRTPLPRPRKQAPAPAWPARLARTGSGALQYVRSLWPTASSSLTGPLGSARGYRVLTVEMTDVRAVRVALGGTVNDVMLAMVSRGFHDLLAARGEAVRRAGVRCLVPVATRPVTQAGHGANRISALLADLPVDCADTATAFAVLRERMGHLKRSGEAGAGTGGLAVANVLPSAVVAAALAVLRRVPQRVLTTVATNVPGPRRSQSLLGRPMIALYPYVPIAERIRIGVAVTSYADRLHFGITCDRASVPDVDVFVTAMADGLADLVKVAAD